MGKIVKLVATAGAFIVGGPQAAAAVYSGLTALGIGNPKKPKISQAAVDRQNVRINATAPRTMIFGHTAMATDLRYQSYTGNNQEFYNQIIVCAAHKVTSIEELWIGDQQAWTVGGGVLAPFTGYLAVTVVLEGSSANMVNIDGVWNAANNRRLTGCAYLWIQYKRTGNRKKSESPFANDITSRLTIIGKGMPVYDPRRDSTVPGGSGTMRINDQSTWAFAVGADEIGRNPALVELAYKIGWRIGGVVSVGRGMPSRRISLPSYIAAANLCDEGVSITGGTTELRYRVDGIYDESQGGLEVLGAIHATMDARHRDDGGQLSLHVMHNDLSTPALTFTADDILGPVDWDVWPLSLEEDRNIGRGRFTDARPNSLYQLSDFGEILTTSIDGNDRILSEDFAEVQSASQARRLVRRKLQRLKFPGIMSFEAGARAYGVKVGDPVWMKFPNLAMVNKRFRVRSRSVTLSARVEIVLSEEDSAIYPTGAEDGAPITPSPPTTYNFMNQPLIAQLATIETGATAGGNLIYNGNAETGDTSGWEISENAGGVILTVATPAASGKHSFFIIKPDATSGFTGAAAARAIPVQPGQRFIINATAGGSTATAAGLFLRMMERSTEPATGFIDSSNYDSITTFVSDGPIAGVYTDYNNNIYTVPAGIKFVSLQIVSWTGGPANLAFEVSMTREADAILGQNILTAGGTLLNVEDGAQVNPDDLAALDAAAADKLGGIQDGADVTAAAFPDIDGNTTWTIDANASGTITTGLPLPRRFKAMQGGVDVSSTTSFAVTTTGLVAATVNDTAGADRGVVTLGAGTTGAGTISLTATFPGGAIKNVVIIVTVNRAAMTSGGGAGATSGSVGTNANFSGTGFVAVTPQIELLASASGTVSAAFDASYTAAANVTGRAQIRVAQTSGGAAVAQSADTVGTAFILNEEAGQVMIGEATYSGLTPSAPCFVQAFMRRGSGSGTVTPTGTLTAMQ